MKSIKNRSTLVISAAMIGAVGFGSLTPAFGAPKDKDKEKKVTICFRGHTITIAEQALDSHLKNGATLGPCEVSPIF